MAGIPDLPRFDNIPEGIEFALENGIAVVSTARSAEEIQSDFLIQDQIATDQHSRGILSREAASIVMPDIEEVVTYTEDRFDWYRYAKIYRQDFNHRSFPHQDLGGLIPGMTILIPIAHKSLYTMYSQDWRNTVFQGEHEPGCMLLMRQKYLSYIATPHNFSVVQRPEDLATFSNKRVLMTLDTLSGLVSG